MLYSPNPSENPSTQDRHSEKDCQEPSNIHSSNNTCHRCGHDPSPTSKSSHNPSTTSSAELGLPPSELASVPAHSSFLHNRSRWFEILFIAICCSTQLIAQGQFGMVVIPLYDIGKELGTTDPGELSWMAASNGLTVGMFLVASGRLGDLYGSKRLWTLGFVLIVLFNVASGFCKSRIPFDICRALAGVGTAMSLPNAVAILGRTYPPGSMRTIAFSVLGALAPTGWIWGGAIGALLGETVGVRWTWFFTAILSALLLSLGTLILPPDDVPPTSNAKWRQFDLLGFLLLILAMGFLNFSWNQAAVTGWPETYVWVLLVLSLASFVAFFLYEKRMGGKALVPMEVLQRGNLLVYLSLWVGWMSFGVFIFYTPLFIRNIRGFEHSLSVAAQLSPLGPGGVIAALLVPYAIVRFPGHQIFLLSMICFLVGDIMASVAPAHGSYWSVTFPSLILVVAGPDMSFATGQLIVSNSVDREFQGIAGGIVSMITNYSLSIGLGMAGTVERYVRGPDGTLLEGYRAALYFGTGLAALACVVVAGFVRMPKQGHHTE